VKSLRDAIQNLIETSQGEGFSPDVVVCDAHALWVLQEEFNIHFREPENPQLAIIERPFE